LDHVGNLNHLGLSWKSLGNLDDVGHLDGFGTLDRLGIVDHFGKIDRIGQMVHPLDRTAMEQVDHVVEVWAQQIFFGSFPVGFPAVVFWILGAYWK
jgi:hypothetical protein